MGWVMVTIIALIAGFTLLGLKRGFVKVVIGLASMFIAIVGAALLTKPVGAFLDKNTGIRASIDKTIVSFVDEQIENAKQEAMKAAGVKDESELKVEDLIKKIDELSLPASVRDVIAEAAKKDVAAAGHAAAKEAAEKLSDAVINGIAFIGCFIVLLIALIIIGNALNVVAKLPVLHQLNGVLGGLLGFVEGIVAVWLFFAVIMAFAGQDWAQDALKQINDNDLLSGFYIINPILKLF
ncbi:MAG: CvpA family protein [Lachnospiraceae bacterium]|nr:CvpA family protein [Lachnospiraceae bacterium]MBR4587318.1 CvpA family protein [Lachnospiraceae bacterium]